MDDASEELSKRLHEVLDVIGASEYIREKYWEFGMLYEITGTFDSHIYPKSSNNICYSYYQCGSQCEGTTILDLYSDMDIVCCEDGTHVVENLFESKQQGISYLLLSDEDTKPGYVCLQVVHDKCPIADEMGFLLEDGWLVDKKGRVCVTNTRTINQPSYRNGPANRIPDAFCPIDDVPALRCRKIPRSANSWLHRIRKYDWPSEKQLKAMGSYGCLFVGVGHSHSENTSFEWRISFSLQERDLVSSLNETQHKCYILLKMIKKDIIESKVGECISSYHCKTSLFYTIENSHKYFWTNDKLILCVQQCLKRLFIWVKAKHCPNYFIPEANMFDKLNEMTLEKIEYVLNGILESGIKFLYLLTCGNVGELLKSKLCGDKLVCILPNTSTCPPPRYSVCTYITEIIYHRRNFFMQHMCLPNNTVTCYMNGIKHLLLYLQHTNHVTEHTTRDVRMALDSIIPLIQLQYTQCMFVQYLSQGISSDLQDMTITNAISEISDYDLISSKLSLASLYIQVEHLQEKCKRIVVSCENSLEPHIMSLCKCHDDHDIHIIPALAKKMMFTDMSSKYYRRFCITGCMVFHSSQFGLVHTALHYEMFRTVFTQPGSEFEIKQDYWLNWITIDSQIYLYFLQYLLYSKTEQVKETKTALKKLALVIYKDGNLGHKETGLNLYGWIWIQENQLQAAWIFFCKSWRVRPFKNAAKWHMLILLREVIKENRVSMNETKINSEFINIFR